MHFSLKYRKTHSNSCNCTIYCTHILYNFICTFLWYFIQIMHLSWKYRKTHSNSCNFSRWNINFITIIRLIKNVVRYPGCRFKTSPNSAPILSECFKFPYIVQFYMYFPTILHSNDALEFKVQKNALKLMQL
jgi:hypothetical protein